MKIAIGLMLCVLAVAAQAQSMGRLFHTPEQRALLDTARKTTPMNVEGEAETENAPNLTLRGIVTRSDGKRSVWMNNHLEHGATSSGAQERNQTQVQLPGGSVKLKVGQRIDPSTGLVTENFRQPVPEPAKAAPARTSPSSEAQKTPVTQPRHEDNDPEQRPAP